MVVDYTNVEPDFICIGQKKTRWKWLVDVRAKYINLKWFDVIMKLSEIWDTFIPFLVLKSVMALG